MNWDQIAGKWKQARGSIRTKWADITDSDFEMIAGNRDKLVGILQERYGIAREEAQQRADVWAKSLRDSDFDVPKTSTGKP